MKTEHNQAKLDQLLASLEAGAPALVERTMAIFTQVPDDNEPAFFQCPRCQDTGIVMMTEGNYDVGGTRNGGKQRTVMTTATPGHLVAVRCRCNPKKHGGDA